MVWLVGWLFEFHGTSTTMGYSIPNPVYIYELYMIYDYFLYELTLYGLKFLFLVNNYSFNQLFLIQRIYSYIYKVLLSDTNNLHTVLWF